MRERGNTYHLSLSMTTDELAGIRDMHCAGSGVMARGIRAHYLAYDVDERQASWCNNSYHAVHAYLRWWCKDVMRAMHLAGEKLGLAKHVCWQ